MPPMNARTLATAATLLLAALPATAQVVFPVTFDATASGLTSDERARITSHLQAAGARWASLLGVQAARSLEIQVEIDDTRPTAGAASFTTVFAGVFGGRDTFEQSAAHELRTGNDPNGATPDIRVLFNTNYLRNELWFDPDPVARTAPVPGNRTDAMSVMLHELGHAFAYNGWANGAGVPPETFWSTFDRWMLPGAPTLFDGPVSVQVWGSRPDLTTNNIHHWSNDPVPGALRKAMVPEPVVWRDGVPTPQIRCHGLPSLDAPPSLSAKGGPPPGLLSELMNGVVFYRGYRYDISALDLAVLADAGTPPLDDPQIFRNGFE